MDEHRRRELEKLYITSPSTFLAKRALLKSVLHYTDDELDEIQRELELTLSGKTSKPVKIPKF